MKRLTGRRDDGDTMTTIYGTIRRTSKKRVDLTYDYEHTQIRVFRKTADLLGPSRFLDVGANIGIYSIHLADVGSLTRIEAFEPTPATFAELVRNTEIQSRPSIFRTHRVALSDTDGTTTFTVYGEMAGNNSIADTDPGRGVGDSVDVDTRRLDGLVDASGEVFMAKIDVEGHELRVIDGARRYLAANSGVVQIECFPGNAASLVETMAELGYERLARLKFDHLFSNITDTDFRSAQTEIVFDEVGAALLDLKKLRRKRRETIRRSRELLDTVKFGTDPTIG